MPTRQVQAEFEQTLIDALKKKNITETISKLILESIMSAITDIFKHYDDRIEQLEAEIADLKSKNGASNVLVEPKQKAVEKKLGDLQQHIKNNNIRMMQIPEAENENLADIVYDIFKNQNES
nr:unnamed protein product [Callosobruchus analis]